jgi:hypothetical protein
MALSQEMLARRERILVWMAAQRAPVLFSDMQNALGIGFADEAFEGLRRDGVIEAAFPEAKLGDSGRQFWGFANMLAAA